MANSKTPYDRVAKLPKQFKALKAYDAERKRGLVHTPEYDERMNALKADGSVMYIKRSINMRGAWMPLATIQGGEIISADAL